MNRLRINHYFGLFMHDSLSKQLCLVSTESDLIFLTSISVLGLQLADCFEGKNGLFHLAQGDVSLSLSVETFHVDRIKLGGFTSVEQSKLVLFHLETREGAIAVENGLFLIRDLAENSFCVMFGSILKFLS